MGYQVTTVTPANMAPNAAAELPSMMILPAVAFMGSTPIGGPAIGWITSDAGARTGLGVGAASCFVAGAIGLVAIRRLRLRTAAPIFEPINEPLLPDAVERAAQKL